MVADTRSKTGESTTVDVRAGIDRGGFEELKPCFSGISENIASLLWDVNIVGRKFDTKQPD